MPEEPPSQIQVILPHLSRWRSLKQFLPTVLWFIVGVVLEFVSERFLFPLWYEHGMTPLARWVDAPGWDKMSKRWIFFSAFDLVNWLMAILAGVIGGVAIKRHIMRNLCSVGVGFALPPLLFYAVDNFAIPGWNSITECGTLVLLIVCTGLLTHYFKNRIAAKSKPALSST